MKDLPEPQAKPMEEPDLPEPIDSNRISIDILGKLVREHNQLLRFVAFKAGYRHDGWDWVLINPATNHPVEGER